MGWDSKWTDLQGELTDPGTDTQMAQRTIAISFIASSGQTQKSSMDGLQDLGSEMTWRPQKSTCFLSCFGRDSFVATMARQLPFRGWWN